MSSYFVFCFFFFGTVLHENFENSVLFLYGRHMYMLHWYIVGFLFIYFFFPTKREDFQIFDKVLVWICGDQLLPVLFPFLCRCWVPQQGRKSSAWILATKSSNFTKSKTNCSRKTRLGILLASNQKLSAYKDTN